MRSVHRLVSRTLVILGLTVAAALAAPAVAAADITLGPCAGPVGQQCIVSVTRNGLPVSLPTQPGDPYMVAALSYQGSGATYYSFIVQRNNDPNPYSLDTSDTWRVVLNTGSTYPGETFARSTGVTVARGGNTVTGYTVSFTMHPVRMALAEDASPCAGSGVCDDKPAAATMHTGELDGWADDLGYLDSPADAAAMRGFDLVANSDYVSSPLTLNWATHAITLDMANRHFEADGTTVFVGEAEFTLPFAMLKSLYQVDDPASLTAAAFQVSAAGGPAPHVTVTVGATTVHVVMTGITFSKRHLQIRGDMRPGAPRTLTSRRTTAKHAVLRFLRALPHGALVRGYAATCTSGAFVRHASSLRSPMTVIGLRPGHRYTCTIQAKSHAGLGRVARVIIRRRVA